MSLLPLIPTTIAILLLSNSSFRDIILYTVPPRQQKTDAGELYKKFDIFVVLCNLIIFMLIALYMMLVSHSFIYFLIFNH